MEFLTILYIINILVASFIVFYERKKPAATLAWVLFLFVLPGLGIIFYVIFSQLLARQRLYSLSNYDVKQLSPYFRRQKQRVSTGELPYVNEQASKWSGLIRMNQEYAGAYLTQDNNIGIFTSGTECFDAMLEDIKNAKESVNMQVFIMKPDRTGLRFIDALTKKAKEGLEVRLLLDAMGSRKMKRRHFREFKKAGGELAFFFPVRIFKLDLKLNYRNHRKLLIVDRKIGYVGGLNVAREYTGDSEKFGGWRDTHLRITGRSVYDLEERFALDWNFSHKKEMELERVSSETYPGEGSAVQIISSGPERDSSEIMSMYLKMITDAKRHIYIQSPYFVPDDSIFEALKNAALSGVDVNIMIPNKPDHPFVYWVTLQNVGRLAEFGAKIYVYTNGFLHSKVISVDDEAASVGSANFDKRSFLLNFECNALVFDSQVAEKLRKAFEEDTSKSVKLSYEMYCQRPRIIKIKESLSRLVEDIL